MIRPEPVRYLFQLTMFWSATRALCDADLATNSRTEINRPGASFGE
jgi:hypothetical protein